MIPDKVKHIYYRGFLKSCNYSCSYCPFAKRPVNKKELEKDKEALARFVSWVSEQKNILSIMFVPYGEALLHSYYIKAFALLSKMDNVTAISCQTNLSIIPEKFIDQLNEENADLDKVNLWATFHDEMETRERFAEKVHYLNQAINICTGVVGTPQMVTLLKEFKDSLPKPVYLWVNAMEGLNRKYTTEELEIISSVDPQFQHELKNPKADISKCCAGIESIFITAEGDAYACNRSKVSIGNIYAAKELDEPACKTRSCDCFLAYVHRTDMSGLKLFGNGRFMRIPKCNNTYSIFFDIDGTLTNSDGVIEQSIVEAVKLLSTKHRIYLATALPFIYAMRKCKLIRPYIAGGVFANGADIREFDTAYRHSIPMQEVELKVSRNIQTLLFTHKNVLYKTAFTGSINFVTKLYHQVSQMYNENYHILFEDGILSLTDRAATKLNGILQLCKHLQIDHNKTMVVGNGENDIEMLSYFKHSVTVPSASDLVKGHSAYTMNIEQLPVFF